jgi:hypothetical protein
VVTVNVELTEPPDAGVTDWGEREQVVFAGQPVTESATLSVKPFSEVTVTVELPVTVGLLLSPRLSVKDVGLAEMLKSAVAGPPQPLNLNEAIRVYQP